MTARDGRRPATPTSAAAPARAPAARWVFAILGVLGAVAAAGCSDSAPHGPPVLQQVYWETRGGVQTLVWSSIPTDGPVTTIVSPAATQFDLVFDRVIDGSKIEDTRTIDGVQMQVPKPQDAGAAMSPVTVSDGTWNDGRFAGRADGEQQWDGQLQAERLVQQHSPADRGDKHLVRLRARDAELSVEHGALYQHPREWHHQQVQRADGAAAGGDVAPIDDPP